MIDRSDAAITNPAYDLGLILRDLGPEAFEAALRAHGGDLHDRATFDARCAVLEDLAYGVDEHRPEYVDTSVDALRWLFAGRQGA